MPFNPDLRQHKIETAEYRVDGDYSHAIPAYPEYDSATEFNNAFYQERRDENDRLVGIPVLPIEYTDAPPPAEIPDPGLRFTLKRDGVSTPGPGLLTISLTDFAIQTAGNDLDGKSITHHPSLPTYFSGSINGKIDLIYYDINSILRSASFDMTSRLLNPNENLSYYTFHKDSRPDQEFLDSLKYDDNVWIDTNWS